MASLSLRALLSPKSGSSAALTAICKVMGNGICVVDSSGKPLLGDASTAAQARVPVVTSSWRLPPELLRMPFVHTVGFKLVPVKDPHGVYTGISDARWADPDIDEMVAVIRKLCMRG